MTARRATRLATKAKTPTSPTRTPSLTPPPASPPRSSVKTEPTTPGRPSKRRKVDDAETPLHEVKPDVKPSTTPDKATPSKNAATPSLASRKLKSHTTSSTDPLGPFPTFREPTPKSASLAYKILSDMHGPRTRPEVVVANPDRAGCGDSPSVLDALVRTILSQNTSDVNSTRAKKSMDAVYGSSDNWEGVVEGGQGKLEEAIRCGGLSQIKSKVILRILDQTMEKYGKYSLDHMFGLSTPDAMTELISFDGVGPKTASCVLLFCLGRDDFAVDTHVWRISGMLGWRPKTASRDLTYAHLNARVPDEFKYGLHILFVLHGKVCGECKAGGRASGKCELRKAFRGGGGGEGAKVEDEGEGGKVGDGVRGGEGKGRGARRAKEKGGAERETAEMEAHGLELVPDTEEVKPELGDDVKSEVKEETKEE